MPMYGAIISAMNEAHNMYEQVFPAHLLAYLRVRCSERTLRRYMVEMANQGLIVRVGKRKGYKLDKALRFNMAMGGA